jgi:hypothetical protein
MSFFTRAKAHVGAMEFRFVLLDPAGRRAALRRHGIVAETYVKTETMC